MTFSQRGSFPGFVEDEGDAGDVTDPAGAEGDVLKGSPALREFGDSALAEGPNAGDQDVRGARIRMESLLGSAFGPPDWYVDADAGTM